MLFFADCSVFNSLRFLLNISCIFSIPASVYLSVPLLYFQDFGSPLLSLLRILFQVECLFPLHLFILWILLCSFICCMFVCFFILFNLLYLVSPFCRLEGFSSSQLWSLPSMSGLGPIPCESLLVWGTCTCGLMNGIGCVSLKGSAVSSSMFWVVWT